VVAKVSRRLAESKQMMPTFHMERFNLKKLNKVEGKEQYWVKPSNRFVTFENLDTAADINPFRSTVFGKIATARSSRGI
jgi:hypothetical protein